MSKCEVVAVGAATFQMPLPAPLAFGHWQFSAREYCVVSVRDRSGTVGHAVGLTRDGPVAGIVRRILAPVYLGADPSHPDTAFERALASNRPVLTAGIGLRAASLVDVAMWDLAARLAGMSVAELLGGGSLRVPVRAIVGYPPEADEYQIAEEVRELHGLGWRRFKLPIGRTQDLTVRRVRAALDIAGDGNVGLDAAWSLAGAPAALRLVGEVGDSRLEWLEDPFPPDEVAALRRLVDSRRVIVAVGDEQGGPHFPGLLAKGRLVDVVRLDATCAGGISTVRRHVQLVRRSGRAVSLHMFGRVHLQLLAGLSVADSPIEWSPRMWADPYDTALGVPSVVEGTVDFDPGGDGFGRLIDWDLLRDVVVDDPDGTQSW